MTFSYITYRNLEDRRQKTRTVRGSCTKQSNNNVSSLKETNLQSETPCQPVTKIDKPNVSSGLNIGTWNVRTLQTDGNWEILLEEASKFRIDILGLCETHMIGGKKQIKSLPEDVRKMCAERRKAQCLFMNNPTAQNKNDYRKINNKVKYEVKNMEEDTL